MGNKLQNMGIVISAEHSLTDDLDQLLQSHWLFCISNTPIEHVYALDASKLFASNVTVFSARLDGELAGVGSLRKLDAQHAELKSMHTLSRYRGNGIGKALVTHIEAVAKAHGITRISLETGTNEAFKPARDLYKSLGYEPCDAFGEYVLSEHNLCMTRIIQ
jgi:putative acetyltransferase